MNCKPGDLAVIVNDPLAPENVGKLVNVIDRTDPEKVACYEGEEWHCTSPSSVMTASSTYRNLMQPGEDLYIFDRDLRPIRDPGDDAVDETLVSDYFTKELSHG